MRTLISICAGAMLTAGAAMAADMSADQQQLLQRELAWTNAMTHADTATLSGIVADDWMGQNSGGKADTKTSFLNDIKSGTLKITSMTNHDMKPRVFGDVGIVQGADTEKSSYKGKDTSGEYNWMDVWMKRDGKWVAVATQVTKVEPSK